MHAAPGRLGAWQRRLHGVAVARALAALRASRRKTSPSPRPDPIPQVAAWLMCCVKFLVWLLERIVAFINRNAYIIVAVKG
jgi:hypothetical protein